MKPIIEVENLGKRYRIGRREAAYATVRDTLTRAVKAPISRIGRVLKPGRNGSADPEGHIWALKDVSFEVQPGEIVGIIGRNGAGKSTLLKILSRITEPTRGSVSIWGRVASLLEVGTGFHAELTGRENIFLNGAILGMSHREMTRKFAAIVAFAEIDTFIDTPVKHYSSGMYVRLAFAVAVHLEPEVLVIDEVLAVGDAEFQKKCLSKIQEVSQSGRTILFVSHNMYALRHICYTGIILEQGRIIDNGPVNSVIDHYLAQTLSNEQRIGGITLDTESFLVEDVQIYPANGTGTLIKPFDPVEIRVKFRSKREISAPGLYVAFLTLDNQRIAALDFRDFHTAPALLPGNSVELGFSIQSLPLLPGDYQLEVWLKDTVNVRHEQVPRAFRFEVVESPIYGGRKMNPWDGIIGLRATAYDEHVV